jgi:hypothetical protein
VATGTMRREGVTYTVHHIGIPTEEQRPGERYDAEIRMFTTGDWNGPVPVQWHRYEPGSPLHQLLREQPRVA